MKFRDYLQDGKCIGWVYEDSNVFAFFGNKHGTKEVLTKTFGAIQFSYLTQKHGNIWVKAEEAKGQEADAQWTTTSKTALCIQTADCIPALGYHQSQNFCLATHAGWRGIENEILKKSGAVLNQNQIMPSDLVWFIGPHIRKESFEVGIDVADRLQQIYRKSNGESNVLSSHSDLSKKYVDLAQIAFRQLTSLGVPSENIFEFPLDTYTRPELFSFRRDKESSGRNISFIYLK